MNYLKFKTEEELINYINDKNYYYSHFESFDEFLNAAEQYFLNIISEGQTKEEIQEHYSSFGLCVGDVFDEKVREEKFWVGNEVVEVHFYKAYVDCGVPKSDYFYGFIIEETFF